MRYLFLSILCLALAGCGLDETNHRSDRPVSRELASKDISVPFPSSTTDVYYVFHAGGMQEWMLFVRFTVDPKDLDSAVDGILSDQNKVMKTHDSYPSLSIAAAGRGPVFPELSPMPWWSPDSITNGYYRGSTNAPPLYLWVDISKHTIYLCETD
jgi:hypothetical protein